jgi:hypothetical protein
VRLETVQRDCRHGLWPPDAPAAMHLSNKLSCSNSLRDSGKSYKEMRDFWPGI